MDLKYVQVLLLATFEYPHSWQKGFASVVWSNLNLKVRRLFWIILMGTKCNYKIPSKREAEVDLTMEGEVGEVSK